VEEKDQNKNKKRDQNNIFFIYLLI